MKAGVALGVVVLVVYLCCLCQAAQIVNQEERIRYDGHQVLRFAIEDPAERRMLGYLIRRHHLDLWAEGPTWVDVRVHPEARKFISATNFTFSVMIENLQELIEAEQRSIKAADEDFFATYRTLQEFEQFLDGLQADYPSLVTKKVIGRTVEQRNIYGIVITSQKKESSEKVGIVYNGGQHAREWISPMTNAWIAHELVTRYGQDDLITQYVDEFEWTIIPVVNSDGYVYSWTTDRMWRKNRRFNSNSWLNCYGVDTNRNWDFHWNQGGSSSNTCADDFMGPFAFSEPEEVALADYIISQGNVKGYIDFHAYSQLWMTPWGYTSAKPVPADYNLQVNCAKASVEALSSLYGTAYKYGPIATTIYPASGSSADWVYGVANVTLSFAVELRDTGRFGFILPADQIIPTGRETMLGVEAMAAFMLKNL